MKKVSMWELLSSSEEAWDALLEACRKARTSIDIEQFVFGHDGPFVEAFSALLLRKAEQGVRVRLLLDSIGSISFFFSKLRKEMEEGGIEILFHHTIIPVSLRRFIPFLRDHRKLYVIDGREVHIGGVILQERARLWRDTTAIIRGTIVEEGKRLFNTAWEKVGDMRPIDRALSDGGRAEFYLAGNSFRLRDRLLNRVMVRAIAEAKHYVYITTPYFALTYDFKRALLFAQGRGVDVRLLLPRRSDNVWADIIARFFYRWLLRRGIKIYHYTKAILHAKTMSVDGAWATVGSCNLDWLSLFLNYELNVVTTNREFSERLEEMFEEDLRESEEVTLEMSGWYGFFSPIPGEH